MLSEEEEKEINAKMDSLADEYMKREIPKATWNNVENLSFVFTYKKTANLVKATKKLNRSTNFLLVVTVLLLGAVIIQIVSAFVCR